MSVSSLQLSQLALAIGRLRDLTVEEIDSLHNMSERVLFSMPEIELGWRLALLEANLHSAAEQLVSSLQLVGLPVHDFPMHRPQGGDAEEFVASWLSCLEERATALNSIYEELRELALKHPTGHSDDEIEISLQQLLSGNYNQRRP